MVRTATPLNRIPPFDGTHFWVIGVLHRVNPDVDDAGPVMADMETLVHVSPTSCYHCEQPYSPELAAVRCPGNLSLHAAQAMLDERPKCEVHAGTELADLCVCDKCIGIRKQQ